MNIREHLKVVQERLAKVAYVEPPVDRGGRNLDGLQVLLDDARWLSAQLQGALEQLDRLTTPKEYA